MKSTIASIALASTLALVSPAAAGPLRQRDTLLNELSATSTTTAQSATFTTEGSTCNAQYRLQTYTDKGDDKLLLPDVDGQVWRGVKEGDSLNKLDLQVTSDDEVQCIVHNNQWAAYDVFVGSQVLTYDTNTTNGLYYVQCECTPQTVPQYSLKSFTYDLGQVNHDGDHNGRIYRYVPESDSLMKIEIIAPDRDAICRAFTKEGEVGEVLTSENAYMFWNGTREEGEKYAGGHVACEPAPQAPLPTLV